MKTLICILPILVAFIPATGHSQDWSVPVINNSSIGLEYQPLFDQPVFGSGAENLNWLHRDPNLQSLTFRHVVVRGQSGEEGSRSAGAAAATDPSAILTQFQIQNVFTPETYDASGHSNTLILQPVLPFPVAMPGLKEIFPNHIIRPTLPIIAPTADPDGPLGVQGGMGDLTLLDAYVHPVENFGTLILGYNAIVPTATHAQLGLGE